MVRFGPCAIFPLPFAQDDQAWLRKEQRLKHEGTGSWMVVTGSGFALTTLARQIPEMGSTAHAKGGVQFLLRNYWSAEC